MEPHKGAACYSWKNHTALRGRHSCLQLFLQLKRIFSCRNNGRHLCRTHIERKCTKCIHGPEKCLLLEKEKVSERRRVQHRASQLVSHFKHEYKALQHSQHHKTLKPSHLSCNLNLSVLSVWKWVEWWCYVEDRRTSLLLQAACN